MYDSDIDLYFNFSFGLKRKSRLKTETELTHRPITGEIRKIHLFYHYLSLQLEGLRFYDQDGKLIYVSAYKWPSTHSGILKHEISLDEG